MPTQTSNMFAAAASQREREQAKIESDVIGSQPEKPKKRGANATTITLTISREDKVLAKVIAARRGLTVSDLLHFWIHQANKGKDQFDGWEDSYGL